MTVCSVDDIRNRIVSEPFRQLPPFAPNLLQPSRKSTVVQTTVGGITFMLPCTNVTEHAAGRQSSPSNDDRFERDTIEILKRLSRQPIEPTPRAN